MKDYFHDNIITFQRKVVEGCNPASMVPLKCIIPEVSLRDEITTEGFGLAAIELLCNAGILYMVVNNNNNKSEWRLGKEWQKIFFVLMNCCSNASDVSRKD
mmetsp:Transcript_22030/g.30969  ORF Transcript_22030/g.30969 Transcript_22030/m.30969 type:complete len:101 (-) Transcript_22030:1301-1603(-)